MDIFKVLNGYDGHALHFIYDRSSHLRAVIALDTVVDGRAIGGIRNQVYLSERAAIEDACRLARTMSFKAALAELPCGGAKAVIFRHPQMRRAEAFRALGRAIEQLGGLYHAGADLGTTMEDLGYVAQETAHVSHRLEFGKHTARGVVAAIRAALKHRDKSDSLKEIRVAIQGLGEVGMQLAQLLYREGAHLVVADPIRKLTAEAERKFDAEVVSRHDILEEPCDVLAPCALGGVITSDNVDMLACRMLIGSANNPLAEPGIALDLEREGITYVPDFIASAGALIIGVTEVAYGRARAKPERVDRIYDTTLDMLRFAQRRGIPTLHAAETMAAKALKR